VSGFDTPLEKIYIVAHNRLRVQCRASRLIPWVNNTCAQPLNAVITTTPAALYSTVFAHHHVGYVTHAAASTNTRAFSVPHVIIAHTALRRSTVLRIEHLDNLLWVRTQQVLLIELATTAGPPSFPTTVTELVPASAAIYRLAMKHLEAVGYVHHVVTTVGKFYHISARSTLLPLQTFCCTAEQAYLGILVAKSLVHFLLASDTCSLVAMCTFCYITSDVFCAHKFRTAVAVGGIWHR
jgi:hypothetical protein